MSAGCREAEWNLCWRMDNTHITVMEVTSAGFLGFVFVDYEDGREFRAALPPPATKLKSSVGLFCYWGMSVMLGMPTLMPRGPRLLQPQTKQQNRGSSHVSASSSPSLPCRPPLLALLCNSHGWPAAQQREVFMLGHKAHQIQLFWKGWAVFPASERLFTCAEPRCYFASPSVFIMMALFLSFGEGRLQTCHRLIQCHFAQCVFCHNVTMWSTLPVLEGQISFFQDIVRNQC